jgi:ABC-type uncharacterized transport system permease subunit
MAELLFFSALLGYGEGALAYGAEARRPGHAARLAIWGVRVGWLAQTALLVWQASHADGFPWSSWAGALNLFSWLVVSAYLIWGCRPRFRLLGLAVMPVAAALLVLTYVGGGIAERGEGTDPLLAAHVVLMLAGFAGLTLGAGLGGFYLWHERRLKRREARILRLRVPPLQVLERLVGRTLAVSLAALSAGIAFGIASFAADGGTFDAAMGATLAAWTLYAGVLLARFHGRRLAQAAVLGAAFVLVVLPLTHFA